MSDQDLTADSASLPHIPGYELIAEIGRGGMGVVYKAREVARDRLVALKMILPGPKSLGLDVLRFRVEAEAVACLQHPNIVRIFEIGVHENCPFISLEYADQGTLFDVIRKRSMQPREATEAILNICCALQQAHERGIIHRDLKPANILVMGDGTVKVSDFGLAKFFKPMNSVRELYCTRSGFALDDFIGLQPFTKFYESGSIEADKSIGAETFVEREIANREASGVASDFAGRYATAGRFEEESRSRTLSQLNKIRESMNGMTGSPVIRPEVDPFSAFQIENGLTENGSVLGSPSYMAPEQALGLASCRQTDIYSLGATLHHLLTGRPMYQGLGILEILSKIVDHPPPPIEPKVNSELEAIMRKCMEKHISRRYGSCGELAEDLRRFLDGYSTHAARDLRMELFWASVEAPTTVHASDQEIDVQNSKSDVPETKCEPPSTSSWRKYLRWMNSGS